MVQLYWLTQTDADVWAEVLRGTEACHKVRPQAFWRILSWLTGQNLIATPTVSLNNIVLSDVHLINPNTISATLPAGIPVGDYDVWLSNPNGQSGVLLHALHVGRPLYLPTVMVD